MKSESNIIKVLRLSSLPKYLKAEDMYGYLKPYISSAKVDSDTLETLVAKMGKDKVAVIASSKIFNLKFRLKDFSLEILKGIVKVQSSLGNGLALFLVMLEFLQKVGGLTAYQLSTVDAKILLEIYILENEKEIITIDKLFAGLQSELTESQILESLELLEKLSCIRFESNKIVLIEEIVFVRD